MIEILKNLTPIVWVMALGFVWGIAEGMTMVQFSDPRWVVRTNWEWGIRSHRWFGGYHAFDAGAMALGIGMGWYLAEHWPGWWILLGMFFAGWEMKEGGISFARWGTWVAESENLNFADAWERSLSRIWSILIHWCRGIAAIILIWKGW